MLERVEEPFCAPNLYVYWSLARRARELGIRAVIDGVDGDTTVSHGTDWLAELVRRGRIVRAVRECRQLAGVFRQSTKRFFWHFGLAPVVRSVTRSWRRELGAVPSSIAPGFAREVDWTARMRDRQAVVEANRPPRSLREAHHRALTTPLIAHSLEVHDKASAAFGLDHRHPYFDHRLIEFCYGLPPEQRLHGGYDRAIQRRALRGIVPEAIRTRVHKSHWGDQFEQGFLVADRDRIDSLLRNSPASMSSWTSGHSAESWRYPRWHRGVRRNGALARRLARILGPLALSRGARRKGATPLPTPRCWGIF